MPVGETAAAGEHGFRSLCGKLTAIIRGAGLYDHRPALYRAGNIERATHREIFALVIEHVHFFWIEIKSALDVPHKSVVGKGIPQPRHHIIEFASPTITLGVLHVVIEPEIQRRIRIGGGDDIPPGAAATEVIERGKAAGDMIGLVKRGRARRDQPDMFGDGR